MLTEHKKEFIKHSKCFMYVCRYAGKKVYETKNPAQIKSFIEGFNKAIELSAKKQLDTKPLTVTELKELMHDPRYWRDKNPEIVSLVRQGFARVYHANLRTTNSND